MDKRTVLFLTTQLPFPPKSGGTVKSWKFVHFLSENYPLSIASLLKGDDQDHVEEFRKEVSLQKLITKKLSLGRNPINLIKSYLSAPCLNVYRNASNSFKKEVALVAMDFDFLIVDHYEMFQYVPDSYSGKIILHTHNAEFMLWQRMSELSDNPLKKLVLRLEATRVKKYENEIFKRSDLVFSTPSDIELYQKHAIETKKHQLTYHLGNDQLLELPDLEFDNTELAITFIGTLSWEPNVDGLVWFFEKCWSRIKLKIPSCKLYVLGGAADQRIIEAAKNDPQIIFTGFVKDLEDYLEKTRVYIAPLRFGSGMKVKVLEGLYRGVPTVSTSVGAEGLKVKHKESIMIADHFEDFISSCCHLLEDKIAWQRLSSNSRKVAQSNYKWQPLFEGMNVEIQKLLSQ